MGTAITPGAAAAALGPCGGGRAGAGRRPGGAGGDAAGAAGRRRAEGCGCGSRRCRRARIPRTCSRRGERGAVREAGRGGGRPAGVPRADWRWTRPTSASPAGRDRALDEVVPVLAAMGESISRDELVREVADRLDADPGLVMRRLAGEPERRAPAPAARLPRRGRWGSAGGEPAPAAASAAERARAPRAGAAGDVHRGAGGGAGAPGAADRGAPLVAGVARAQGLAGGAPGGAAARACRARTRSWSR